VRGVGGVEGGEIFLFIIGVVEGGGIIFDGCGVCAAGGDDDPGELWRVTGIFFRTATEGVGRKVFALASREFPRRIGAGISLDGLTGGEDGAGVNGVRDRRSARWAAYRRERAV